MLTKHRQRLILGIALIVALTCSIVVAVIVGATDVSLSAALEGINATLTGHATDDVDTQIIGQVRFPPSGSRGNRWRRVGYLRRNHPVIAA